jgi:hypothetical protein
MAKIRYYWVSIISLDSSILKFLVISNTNNSTIIIEGDVVIFTDSIIDVAFPSGNAIVAYSKKLAAIAKPIKISEIRLIVIPKELGGIASGNPLDRPHLIHSSDHNY